MIGMHNCRAYILQVSNIQRPEQYEQVVRDKETAKQNIVVAERERPRMITQADTKKREAKIQVGIIKI